MKRIYNNIRIGLTYTLLICLVTACKKSFLEVVPKGKLIAEKVSDYDRLLNNLDLVNLINANAQVIMGDEVATVEPYFTGASLKTQRLLRWDDVVYEASEDAGELTTPLRNIYTYNKIINELPGAKDGTEQQRQELSAEAMAGRAWTFFLLINYFGKPYNGITSATDPGFPIIKEADVTQTKFSRATVKAVYDFIVDDLTTALPNLPPKITSRLRMSKPAAEALLGKVYTFMGKYDDALPHLNNAIEGLTNADIPVGLYDYNQTFAPGGSFLPLGFTGPNYPFLDQNNENLYAKQAINPGAVSNNEIVIDQKTKGLFTDDDLRLNFFSSTAFFGPPYAGGLLRRAGPGTFLFGVLLPEIYLLRAECEARTNDLAAARMDVETLRSKRMPAASVPVPADTASQQMPLLRFIIAERTREFAVTGFRWFDMRRLSVDPLFSAATYTHTRYLADGTQAATYTLRPGRFVLRFAQKVIDQNPGMENNP